MEIREWGGLLLKCKNFPMNTELVLNGRILVKHQHVGFNAGVLSDTPVPALDLRPHCAFLCFLG